MSNEILIKEPVLQYLAVHGAILRLFGYRRMKEAWILSCLYEAKNALTFTAITDWLIDPAGGLSHTGDVHWARQALGRLRSAGFVSSVRQHGKYDLWSITTAGRVMIARLNQEALKILAERGD